MKVHVEIELTEKQAQRLWEHAIDYDMCSEDRPLADAMGKIWRAIRDAREEAKQRAEANPPDVRVCAPCNRRVVHSRRGRKLPARHKCPHGDSCGRSLIYPTGPRCRACREAKV